MSSKKKILFMQPSLQPPGGGNTVTVWMLEALKDEYDITTLTWETVDVSEINRYYGTSLNQSDMVNLVAPALIRYLIDRIPNDPWHYKRYCVLMRWCKMAKHRYDVVMTSNNESDFGVKGIQYVHYPYHFSTRDKEKRFNSRSQWYYQLLKYFETHLRPWRLISGFSFARMKENHTLVNSEWTGEWFANVYNSPFYVIYPPVPGDFPDVPWQERENGFVCIGRFSGEKRLEEIIDILAEVRQEFPDVHLHIIGSNDDDDDYYQRVIKKVAQHSSWVFLEENLSREELLKLVSQHRYGIHGMDDEHFGIAVAEMLRGGCIPFVPDSGGPVEIVGKEPRLLYHSDADACRKIRNVLNDIEVQMELRHCLGQRKHLFGTGSFKQKILETVSEFLRQKEQAS